VQQQQTLSQESNRKYWPKGEKYLTHVYAICFFFAFEWKFLLYRILDTNCAGTQSLCSIIVPSVNGWA
jgi:hypothetical protein